jgi:hypothetical protein
MNRLKENKEYRLKVEDAIENLNADIDKYKKQIGGIGYGSDDIMYQKIVSVHLNAITVFLCDISKSLAVIADNSEKGDK